MTSPDDWEKLEEVLNKENNEINHVWRYIGGELNEADLGLFFNHAAGVQASHLPSFWESRMNDKVNLSPALRTIMDAALVSDNPAFQLLFGPENDYKKTTAFLLESNDNGYWMIERTEGDFHNPSTLSFPEAKGHGMYDVNEEARELGISLLKSDWERCGIVCDPENNALRQVVKLNSHLDQPGPLNNEPAKPESIRHIDKDSLNGGNSRRLSPAAKSALSLAP